MISICTQFYEKDYNKLTTFLDSIFNSIKCRCEIIILDNRSEKDVDVFTEYISPYLNNVELTYINDDTVVDVLTARKKLVEVASGEYVWFVNVGDELTGIITQNVLEYYKPDIIFFSGYDETSTKKIGTPFTNVINLKETSLSDIYYQLRTQIFGTWSYWFKKSFIKKVFDNSINMSSNYIEDILLRSVAISNADTLIISPEVFYTKKQKTSNTDNKNLLDSIVFERVLAEVEQANLLYKDNSFVIKALNDELLIKHYIQKVLSNFNGTDQELIEIIDRFSKTFNVNSVAVEHLLNGYDIIDYNELNVVRLKYLCGINAFAENTQYLNDTINKSNTKKTCLFNIYGFENKVIYDATLTICITCDDDDYYKAEQLIDNLCNNPFLDNVRILVINNCEEVNINKKSGVEYIDTHENLFAFKSRLIGAKNSETDYIWFIDGDDNIKIDFNLQEYLSKYNTDLISVGGVKNIEDRQFETSESMCYYLLENNYDTSLHRLFISKNVYKKFCQLPYDIKVHLGEDIFLNIFSMLQSNSITISKKLNIYNYNQIRQHLLREQFYTGIIEINNLANDIFPHKIYKRFVDLQMSYVSELLRPDDIKSMGLCDLPYFINIFNKDFDTIELPVKEGCVDVIYMYYGKDLLTELKNLDTVIKCKYNVIVIDLLGNYNGTINVIHEQTFYKSIEKASEKITSEHVWIIESYKKIHRFTGVHLSGHSTYFTDMGYDFHPLIRNNVIFTRDDFKSFIKSNVDITFSNLSVSIYDFAKKHNFVKSINYLVEADVFDESDINFIFINFDKFLEKSNIAQICISNVKDTFPKSNVIIHDEHTLKDVLEESKITQNIMKLRNQTSHYKCFEDDVLRLLLVRDTKKSIYVDMDIIITDKDKFLKALSTYPTFCQYNGNTSNLEIYNELIWSLNGSSFIDENIKFYDSVTVDEVCNTEKPLYNAAVAKIIVHKFGGKLYGNTFNVLDLHTTSVYDNDIYFHFRASRYSYFGKKNEINIGITLQEYSTDGYLLPFIKENQLDAVFVLCDWRNVHSYHELVNECYVTDIGMYNNLVKTVDILINSIESNGVKVKNICYYNNVNENMSLH